MTIFKCKVKWSKKKFEVDVDVEEDLATLKAQLFSLSGVPVERQTIMIKGKKLKDDVNLADLIKNNKARLVLLGTAEVAPTGPKKKIVFEEDLTPDEKTQLTGAPGGGLRNLGNTCYMNSTLQCLRSVTELKESLIEHSSTSGIMRSGLTSYMGELFKSQDKSATPVIPALFTQCFRTQFKQFDEKDNNGHHKQQDADECLQQLMTAMANSINKTPSGSQSGNMIDYLFGGKITHTWKNTENEKEEPTYETERFRKLKCFIKIDVNYMYQGIQLGLEDKIEKRSPTLNRSCIYSKNGKISSLPRYLIIHYVRFFWKANKDGGTKAKVLRKVVFQPKFDIMNFVDDDLKKSLGYIRQELTEEENKRLGLKSIAEIRKEAADKRKKKKVKKSKDSDPVEDEEKKVEKVDVSKLTPLDTSGNYSLQAVVTHKGRSADSGHYVGWVKKDGDDWFKYDDDVVSMCKEEDILKLSGGGDWHMTYLHFYKRIDDVKGRFFGRETTSTTTTTSSTTSAPSQTTS